MDKSQGVEGGAGNGTSTRPYLIRALHDWCTDNGFTPYIAVHVDRSVQVPMEYVSKNEIVLNVGFDATSGLDLGNDFIQFKARFGGVAREILVPVDHVVAIYARENGQGMAFPAPEPVADGAPLPSPAPQEPRRSGLRLASEVSDDEGDEPPPPDAPGGAPRPTLKRVK
ncbi:MAG: ClpXP protease specificity-enhancing factor [Roseateles sp.]|uniref:ClpXP protease specificity-enhancing factor n=1 Tax=Roseateles sp. TaxID=1971397 RepID=UPI0040367B54